MESIDTNEKELIQILESVKKLTLEPRTNLSWSTFDSKEELVSEIDAHIHKIRDKDYSNIQALILLFAPTSDFQEISLSSGWGNEYLNLSERFDTVIKILCKKII